MKGKEAHTKSTPKHRKQRDSHQKVPRIERCKKTHIKKHPAMWEETGCTPKSSPKRERQWDSHKKTPHIIRGKEIDPKKTPPNVKGKETSQNTPRNIADGQYHLLQRYNSDSNACYSSFCGIATSSRVIAVLMVDILLKNILLTSISYLGMDDDFW